MIQFSDEELFAPVPRLRTSQRVAEALRSAILRGRVAAGDLLPPERQLAARFGVTRNTVREALRSLEQLRLVSIRQGSGVRVQDYLEKAGIELLVELLAVHGPASGRAIDDDLLVEVLQARAILGEAMIRYAVERYRLDALDALAAAVHELASEAALEPTRAERLLELEFEVHACLLRGAGNRALVLLHNTLRRPCRPLAPLFLALVREPPRLAACYHRGVDALRRGDREAAKVSFCASFSFGDEVIA